jgi:hypothetical protein
VERDKRIEEESGDIDREREEKQIDRRREEQE